jgi:diacylglycerol O-acyltransferase / wax synthase
MDPFKESPKAVVAFGILNAIGMTPVQIERVVTNLFAAKATAVMTNVPGPRQVLYLADKPLREIMFWVLQPAHLGMGISILSYAGEVVLGVTNA